ncbi:MAG: class I SAM-dependent methyltransferase [Anaerolineae bacterium]|nr:class I SAM-dependent methyltransferase [Anaerolineae bacterium]
MAINIREHNRAIWNKQVEWKTTWTIPVSQEEVAAARRGEWGIYLTPTITVPPSWFPADLHGCEVLGLASGGGQQGPLLAAAGAKVTIFDNSPAQLAQDRMVAERDGLEIMTIEGDMRDLSVFPDASFDLIVHPVSNCFIPDVMPVWREAYRVLRPNGALLAGFNNPARYLFDYEVTDKRKVLEVKYKLPYDAVKLHTEEEIQRLLATGECLEFGHSLDTLIGGQIAVGFLIAGLYEDTDREDENWHDMAADYMPLYIATRAIKADIS